MRQHSFNPKNSEADLLSIAVAPNIFDVFQEADHIASLCLANLMSQSLWGLKEKIQNRLLINSDSDSDDIPASIRAIQKYINKSFTHLHSTEIAGIYGLLDLNEERKRFLPSAFAAMVSGLKTHFQSLPLTDEPLSAARNEALGWLEKDRFPNYYYSNIDVIKAHRTRLGQSKKSPYGVTSCLDETALFIALSLVIPKPTELRAMMVMSSISHYGAFGYSENGTQWWFNGKNQLFSKPDWDRRVEDFGGDRQACFDHLFSNFSRITTVSGSADLHTGSSDIPEPYLKEYLHEMQAFFGVRLRQLESLDDPTYARDGEADHASFLRDLIGLESRDELFKRMHGRTEDWIQSARYCFRSLEVDDFIPYLESARRNPIAKEIGRTASSLDFLMACVKEISGSTSIFNSSDQIAMPDETLRFNTGSHRDKGLLLHVLSEYFGNVQGMSQPVETIFSTEVTLVKIIDEWINMNDFDVWTTPLPETVLFRI